MTAQILQLRDYQSKADLARMYGETTLEQQASGLINYLNDLTAEQHGAVASGDWSKALDCQSARAEAVLFGGAGIDGMFVAPEKGPA